VFDDAEPVVLVAEPDAPEEVSDPGGIGNRVRGSTPTAALECNAWRHPLAAEDGHTAASAMRAGEEHKNEDCEELPESALMPGEVVVRMEFREPCIKAILSSVTSWARKPWPGHSAVMGSDPFSCAHRRFRRKPQARTRGQRACTQELGKEEFASLSRGHDHVAHGAATEHELLGLLGAACS